MASGSLGHLAATVTLDIDPFKSSSRALNSQIKATGSALRAQESALKGYGSSLNGMKSVYGSMGQQMKNYEAKLQAQKQTYQDLTKKTADTAEEQAKLTTRQANAASQYNKTSAQMEALRAKMNATQRQITLQSNGWYQAGQKVSTFGTHITNASQKLSTVGSTMTRGVTTPIVAGMGLAVKSAMSFNDEINSIGPLLTNGAAVTGKFKTQLDQMGNASKRWAQQYGISTNSINKGMADLVRAGYSANQTMKMMPAILDASRASGEDFNTVMDVVTSTMTQFGVKASHTTSVTDAMTYAANATKSGFADMGEAMKYTGQSAHAAGIDLNTTVAAIGLLSNAGLQGSTAGTAFNMMLQKLTAGSMAAGSPMQKLGVNIDAFKKGTIGLPEVINEVTKATAGMNKGQKVAAVTAAFGERGGRAMLALMNAGSKQLTDLTAKTGQAAGATKKVSDMMGTTAKAQFDRFKSSVQVLGIEVGNNLIPAITPLVGKATEIVKAFGNLDKGTQQSIIKFALFSAAIGPVASVISKVGSVIGGTSRGIGAFASAIGRMQSAAKLGGTGLQILKSGFSQAAYESTTFAGQAAGAASGMSKVGSSAMGAARGFSLLNPYVLGATAVIGAGVAVWELWGKKAVESSQRTQRWGADIGKSADDAASKFKNYATQANVALDDTASSATTNGKTIEKAFAGMAKSAEQAAKKQKTAADKLAESIGGAAGAAIEAEAAKEDKANQKHISKINGYYKQVQSITKQARDKNVSLTQEQRDTLHNLEVKMAQEQVQTLGLSSKKQRLVLQAELNQTSKATKSQLDQMAKASADAANKELDNYNQTYGKIKHSTVLSTQEKNKALEALENEHNNTMNQLGIGFINAEKARGKSREGILQDMQDSYGWTVEQAKSAMKAYEDAQKQTSTSVVKVTADMKKSVSAAADSWNSLILDPKTGKIKTNAQAEVTKAVQSKDKWNQIKLLEKKGKLSTNAKEMVANGLLESGKWNNMSWSERKAWVRSNAGVEVAKGLESAGKWNGLTLQQKEAIVNSKGKKELAENIVKFGLWNSLPEKTKKLLAKDAGAHAALTKGGIDVDKYNGKKPIKKNLKGDASSVTKASNESQKKVDQHNKKSVKKKDFTGAAGSIIGAANQSVTAQDKHNKKNVNKKSFTGNSSNVQTAARTGWQHIDTFNGKHPGPKTFTGHDNASGPASRASAGVDQFARKRNHTVTLTTIINTVKNFFSRKKNAKGTNYHPGGLMEVNDQVGSTFRELVTMPDGQSFIPAGRNVIFDAPRGTKVLKASLTQKLFNVPQFATGTSEANRAVNTILNTPNQAQMDSNNLVAIQNDNADVVASLNEQTGLYREQIALMNRLIDLATSKKSTDSDREMVRNLSQQFNKFDSQRGRGRLTT
ncbi:hypothetical protein LFYK43_14410 [Ligilactobacillus salitolerans]|uniref:Phage tail tape measure protein domain-containing protein n=1 Tax=Ligilactobacillus salitolerans TaxID=1808352 RepID=A0A401ITX1_9LACO|nr:phage tail tape measure protein [Ligilactobacillus salitolerans]GBG94982.1 hypothetical protein LFYK43_14410 [Ligilactobacillus salitolerans]